MERKTIDIFSRGAAASQEDRIFAGEVVFPGGNRYDDQFISTAISEKISAFMTRDYLEERAARASKGKFMDALSRVPDIEPEAFDKLEE